LFGEASVTGSPIPDCGTIVVARSADSSVTALEVLAGAVETTGFAVALAHVEVGRRVEVGNLLDTPAQGRPFVG
jgi:hypothetical protein